MTKHHLSFARALPSFLDRADIDAALSQSVGIAAAPIVGTSGNDNLTGTGAADILQGLAGDDTLDGGAGADILQGGKGNDTYMVDNTGDLITEQGPGTDSVFASASYQLANGVENLTLTGTAVMGTGNTAANIITGNAGDNVLDGRGGLDAIDGMDGSDVYLVRNGTEHSAAEFTDSGATGVDEIRFGGTGTVKFVMFAGDTGIERLVIGAGTAAVADTSGKNAASVDATLAANALTIIGNEGANQITGTAFADTITAGSGNDKVTGGAGNDTITSGNGNDTLAGGTGADTFVFDVKGGVGNVDTFTDFVTGQDKLQLSKAVFTGFTVTGAITAAQFYSSGTAVTAHDADDRIIFNTATGAVYYDADGNGTVAAAVQIAVIGIPHPGLAASDFAIIN
ncbi:MAG TPA: calcium-binding protein [Ramlibacter sp.]|nr:calcium-binding protein [Ramlibacter sp.]